MKLKTFYAIACVLGTLLPLRHFYHFLVAHGLDIPEFFSEIYATPIGAFFAADVSCSAVIFLVFIVAEGRRLRIPRYGLPTLGLMVGVSLALPWFLYLRQRRLDLLAKEAIVATEQVHR